MSTPRLSYTSYLVLGLVAGLGTATPYELKQMVNLSIGNFWSFPHSQLYGEPDRLTDLGLLEVEQEDSGRHRKRYSATEAGRAALQAWLRDPDTSRTEIREPGLLQLFFGALADDADMTRIAQARVKLYEQELDRYAEIEKNIADHPDMHYPYATLRLGIAFTRACLAFWTELAGLQPAGELRGHITRCIITQCIAVNRHSWPPSLAAGQAPHGANPAAAAAVASRTDVSRRAACLVASPCATPRTQAARC